MKSLDIHTHIMPEHVPNWFEKFGYGDFIRLEHHRPCCARMIKGGKVFREIEHNCWDPKSRLIDMDDTEVSMQVISTIPVLFNYWAKPEHGLETSRFFNDHIAQCVAERPDRFIGIGTVPLQDVDLAIKEMERCVRELRMPGLEIGSNVNRKNLSEPEFDPFWQAAEELNCALFIHPWEVMGAADMQKYWLPWLVGMPAETSRAICSLIFGGVFERFPKLRIAFAHGGGSFPFTIGRIQHGFDVRPDLCAIDNGREPRAYLGRFWIDALLHDANALSFAIQLLGADKVCMGSDYPFPLGEHRPGKLIKSMDFPEAMKQQLLWDNGMSWLGLA
jgi:aminocarboxymuconate-semialdehyde decarboxylase